MLKLEIERLIGEKYGILFDAWEGDYVHDARGGRRRALPMKKVIELFDGNESIRLSDKIDGPKDERLKLHYYLSNRRLNRGTNSISELLQVDPRYFSEHIDLTNQASRLLSLGEKNSFSPYEANKLFRDFDILLSRSEKKYNFETYLACIFKHVLLDQPKLGWTMPRGANDLWHFRLTGYNEWLYTQSFNLYYAFKEEFVYEKIEKPKRRKSFVGGVLEAVDDGKIRKQEIRNRWIASDEFEHAINEDLGLFFQ